MKASEALFHRQHHEHLTLQLQNVQQQPNSVDQKHLWCLWLAGRTKSIVFASTLGPTLITEKTELVWFESDLNHKFLVIFSWVACRSMLMCGEPPPVVSIILNALCHIYVYVLLKGPRTMGTAYKHAHFHTHIQTNTPTKTEKSNNKSNNKHRNKAG